MAASAYRVRDDPAPGGDKSRSRSPSPSPRAKRGAQARRSEFDFTRGYQWLLETALANDPIKQMEREEFLHHDSDVTMADAVC